MRRTQKQHRVIKGFFFLAVLLLVPQASAHAAPCIVYGYTSSGNHQFLMGNNSSLFGDNLTIIHNCENVSIEMDGQFYAYLSTNAVIPIQAGLHQFNFSFDNKTVQYANVMFYPNYLEWEENYRFEVFEEKPDMVAKNIIESQLNWAVAIGIGITWILCVYVYWNLINTFVQRNFIEEVVQ